MEDNYYQITEGIENNIFRAVDISFENNSKDTFMVLCNFMNSIIIKSIQHKSISNFNKYIIAPLYIYNSLFNKAELNNNLRPLRKTATEYAILRHREIFSFLSYHFKNHSLESINEYNKYAYECFNCFSKLLMSTINNDDKLMFDRIIEEYGQIDTYIPANSLLDVKLKILNRTKNNNQSEIDELKIEYSIKSRFIRNQRHVLVGLRYWLYYLFSNNKITQEKLSKYINNINIDYSLFENSFSDILYFNNLDIRDYMGWDDWDYQDRIPGKIYTTHPPSYWLTFGFVIDLISNKSEFRISDYEENEITQIEYIFELVRKFIDTIKISFHKWQIVLNNISNDEFEDRTKRIIQEFAKFKRRVVENKERSIVSSKISLNIVNNFRISFTSFWRNQFSILDFFEYFNNVKTTKIDDLNNYGSTLFLEKSKMMFIDNDHYQMIYGLDRIGLDFGKMCNDFCLSKILESITTSTKSVTLSNIIQISISDLKNKGYTPNIIILHPDILYVDFSLSNSPNFTNSKRNSFDNLTIANNYVGDFDNIPIFTINSSLLRNKVIIADFIRSFSLFHSDQQADLNSILFAKVREVDENTAELKLIDEKDKWLRGEDGITLSEEDAKTLIKTSVFLDVDIWFKFEINNIESFCISNYILEE